jgi:hypothetical protein
MEDSSRLFWGMLVGFVVFVLIFVIIHREYTRRNLTKKYLDLCSKFATLESETESDAEALQKSMEFWLEKVVLPKADQFIDALKATEGTKKVPMRQANALLEVLLPLISRPALFDQAVEHLYASKKLATPSRIYNGRNIQIELLSTSKDEPRLSMIWDGLSYRITYPGN